MTRNLYGDLVVSRGHLVSDISIPAWGFFFKKKTKLWLWKITKVALLVHLHTDSRSLSIANCIQAGGLICLPGPPDWEMGQSLNAGARPVPWAKCLFFLLAVFCVALPCLLLTDVSGRGSLHWSYRAKVGHDGGVGEGGLCRSWWGRGGPHSPAFA